MHSIITLFYILYTGWITLPNVKLVDTCDKILWPCCSYKVYLVRLWNWSKVVGVCLFVCFRISCLSPCMHNKKESKSSLQNDNFPCSYEEQIADLLKLLRTRTLFLKTGRLAMTAARMCCTRRKGMGEENCKNLENICNREVTSSRWWIWQKTGKSERVQLRLVIEHGNWDFWKCLGRRRKFTKE